MKQAIGIPMEIDRTWFWPNSFLYSYEEEYISLMFSSNKIKARHFNLTKSFVDDNYAINNGGEFGRSIYDIYISKRGWT